MDVVTAYLYRSLDLDIYMNISEGISVSNANGGRNIYCVKLNKSLYGLKQPGRMFVLVSSFTNPQLDFTLFQYMLII
jgi:hypothetical protein